MPPLIAFAGALGGLAVEVELCPPGAEELALAHAQRQQQPDREQVVLPPEVPRVAELLEGLGEFSGAERPSARSFDAVGARPLSSSSSRALHEPRCVPARASCPDSCRE